MPNPYQRQEQRKRAEEFVGKHELADAKGAMLEYLVDLDGRVHMLIDQVIKLNYTQKNAYHNGLDQSSERLRALIAELHNIQDKQQLVEFSQKVRQEYEHITQLFHNVQNDRRVDKDLGKSSKEEIHRGPEQRGPEQRARIQHEQQQRAEKIQSLSHLTTMIGKLKGREKAFETYKQNANPKRLENAKVFQQNIAEWKKECEQLNKDIISKNMSADDVKAKLKTLSDKIDKAVDEQEKSLKGHLFSGRYSKLLAETKAEMSDFRKALNSKSEAAQEAVQNIKPSRR